MQQTETTFCCFSSQCGEKRLEFVDFVWIFPLFYFNNRTSISLNHSLQTTGAKMPESARKDYLAVGNFGEMNTTNEPEKLKLSSLILFDNLFEYCHRTPASANSESTGMRCVFFWFHFFFLVGDKETNCTEQA